MSTLNLPQITNDIPFEQGLIPCIQAITSMMSQVACEGLVDQETNLAEEIEGEKAKFLIRCIKWLNNCDRENIDLEEISNLINFKTRRQFSSTLINLVFDTLIRSGNYKKAKEFAVSIEGKYFSNSFKLLQDSVIKCGSVEEIIECYNGIDRDDLFTKGEFVESLVIHGDTDSESIQAIVFDYIEQNIKRFTSAGKLSKIFTIISNLSFYLRDSEKLRGAILDIFSINNCEIKNPIKRYKVFSEGVICCHFSPLISANLHFNFINTIYSGIINQNQKNIRSQIRSVEKKEFIIETNEDLVLLSLVPILIYHNNFQYISTWLEANIFGRSGLLENLSNRRNLPNDFVSKVKQLTSKIYLAIKDIGCIVFLKDHIEIFDKTSGSENIVSPNNGESVFEKIDKSNLKDPQSNSDEEHAFSSLPDVERLIKCTQSSSSVNMLRFSEESYPKQNRHQKLKILGSIREYFSIADISDQNTFYEFRSFFNRLFFIFYRGDQFLEGFYIELIADIISRCKNYTLIENYVSLFTLRGTLSKKYFNKIIDELEEVPDWLFVLIKNAFLVDKADIIFDVLVKCPQMRDSDVRDDIILNIFESHVKNAPVFDYLTEGMSLDFYFTEKFQNFCINIERRFMKVASDLKIHFGLPVSSDIYSLLFRRYPFLMIGVTTGGAKYLTNQEIVNLASNVSYLDSKIVPLRCYSSFDSNSREVIDYEFSIYKKLVRLGGSIEPFLPRLVEIFKTIDERNKPMVANHLVNLVLSCRSISDQELLPISEFIQSN